MEQPEIYDVIIIGGSYAGLSAALSLGRSLRKVLVIDSGNPCNRVTPYSHNFLTNDGSKPKAIRDKARAQLAGYQSVTCLDGLVLSIAQSGDIFEVSTQKDEVFTARKLLFATGVTDTIPNIQGFAECWGISILHCPYCHGFESKGLKTSVLGNGDMGYELAKTISHWAGELTLYTNGTSTLSPEEVLKLNKHDISVVQNEIDYIEHENGQVVRVHFKDTEPEEIKALYTQLPFIQQCSLPQDLGCAMTEKGFIEIDKCLQTTIPGIYAAGDCVSLFRSVANAVAMGSKAGAMINKCLIEEDF